MTPPFSPWTKTAPAFWSSSALPPKSSPPPKTRAPKVTSPGATDNFMHPLSSRITFDRYLEKLSDQVLVLSSMVADAIRASIEALKRRDHAAARRIYDADERI